MNRRLTLLPRLTLLCMAALALPVGTDPPLRAAAPVTVVASGLANPRGFFVESGGDIFVAVNGPPGPPAGAVRVSAGGPATVVEGLPAYRIVLGSVTGVSDVAALADRRHPSLSGGALSIASPAFGADNGEGSILRVDLTDGTATGVPPIWKRRLAVRKRRCSSFGSVHHGTHAICS